MTTTLYRNARLYAPGSPGSATAPPAPPGSATGGAAAAGGGAGASPGGRSGTAAGDAGPGGGAGAAPGAFVVEDGVFTWVGTDAGPGADETVDLGGAFVTPAFVDAHVHATATGLMLTQLDLHGCASLTEALSRVEAAARRTGGRPILGTGWDETHWPERRPPTAAELDRAAYGGVVYLSRADVHGAVASSALLMLAREAEGLPGWEGDGLVRLDAHHAVRRVALASLRPSQVADAQRACLAEAARLGIGCVHEMSGPDVAGRADLESLLSIDDSIDVVAYWGDLGDVSTALDLGLRGAGGDLFCDGAIGSYTAAFREPYADDPARSGTLRYDAEEVAAHVDACVRAGLQTGFHVIGDLAVETVLDAFELAASRLGLPAVLAGRHRLEHVEAASPESVARMARLGLVASVQPAFDAEWGGAGRMYESRLGAARAATLNPYAAFARAGVVMAFGADAPVTPLDPWGGVRAAVHHRTPGLGVSPRAAFLAATRGGWRAAGDDEAGVIAPGAPATFAVWDAEPLPPRPTDERIAGWSTDAGWSEVGLPDGTTTPDCLRTVVRGRTVWNAS